VQGVSCYTLHLALCIWTGTLYRPII